MYFGRVVGRVWSTVKNPHLVGLRLLVVQPLSPRLETRGKPIICADCVGAGTGELVYWVRGKEASFPFLPQEPPVDTTVVGIVDSVHLQGASEPATVPPPAVPRTAVPPPAILSQTIQPPAVLSPATSDRPGESSAFRRSAASAKRAAPRKLSRKA